jgi:hypothetical protein
MKPAMKQKLPQLGAPDPERNTSTIIDESQYDEPAAARDVELEAPAPACYFNDEAFPHRAYVQSGPEVLQCERGVWVRKGEKRPD